MKAERQTHGEKTWENEQTDKETRWMSISVLGTHLRIDLGVWRTLFAAACMEYTPKELWATREEFLFSSNSFMTKTPNLLLLELWHAHTTNNELSRSANTATILTCLNADLLIKTKESVFCKQIGTSSSGVGEGRRSASPLGFPARLLTRAQHRPIFDATLRALYLYSSTVILALSFFNSHFSKNCNSERIGKSFAGSFAAVSSRGL